MRKQKLLKTQLQKPRKTKNLKKLEAGVRTYNKMVKETLQKKTYTNINFSYPYILNITTINHNIFFNLTDLSGNTKIWTNAGRLGFKGKDKSSYMAIMHITSEFFKKIISSGIHFLILKYNGQSKQQRPVKKAIRRVLKKTKTNIQIIGIEMHLSTPFGGCRAKKKRRL